jgi:hypothetical protein
MCDFCYFQGEFEKNGRFGVSVGDAAAISALSRLHDLLGFEAITDDDSILIDRQLGDVGVLAEAAAEVASYRSNGIRKRARQKMIKRFFFNGVDVTRDEPTVNQGVQHPIPVFADVANPPLAIDDEAAMTAKMASHLVIFELFVQQRLHRNDSFDDWVFPDGMGNRSPAVTVSTSVVPQLDIAPGVWLG